MQTTLNDEWVAAHPAPSKAQRRGEVMRARFGDGPEGKKCTTCKHLTSHYAHKKFFKCLLYGDTASSATDWNSRQAACAKWEEAELRGGANV